MELQGEITVLTLEDTLPVCHIGVQVPGAGNRKSSIENRKLLIPFQAWAKKDRIRVYGYRDASF
jgi:hypothetical protein